MASRADVGDAGAMRDLCPPHRCLTASANTLHVTVENVAFGDLPTDAQVGDVVEWANKDFVADTATARDGSFDVNLMPGKSGRIVLSIPARSRSIAGITPPSPARSGRALIHLARIPAAAAVRRIEIRSNPKCPTTPKPSAPDFVGLIQTPELGTSISRWRMLTGRSPSTAACLGSS